MVDKIGPGFDLVVPHHGVVVVRRATLRVRPATLRTDENDGEPVDDFVLMKTAHTNKHTGEIDDGVVRDVLSLIETQKEDEATRLSQHQTDLDATSTASTNLSRIRINEIVESKKGRLVGLGRRARSVPPSAPQPYVDPEGLMDQLNTKNVLGIPLFRGHTDDICRRNTGVFL
ncbi:hypothetical protein F2Q69_00027871 [Brassica cretica]|uniref:Uncharacterized protein n=1 Tax=Brassica cretica TaxID=69181 RepID=A0A8S9S6L7_BRACR|nr:hypothetical protein F2Q69_00027871 [Brassica cretica]